MKKILLLSLLIYINKIANAQVCLNSPTTYSAGMSSWAVTSADFNSDGKKDLAVANYSSNNFSILMNTGMGSFGAITNFNVGFRPFSIISDDFNQDGNIDIATANRDSGNVTIFLGAGNGSFGIATKFIIGAGTFPSQVITTDFNGDGYKDLATVNYFTNNVSILLGTGTGTFGPVTNFAVGTWPLALCNADFNSDGNNDLAVSNPNSNDISILLGTGSGTFSPATTFTLNNSYAPIMSSDFNSDGKADLAVVTTTGSGYIAVLFGSDTGTFSVGNYISIPQILQFTNTTGTFNYADLNNDNKPDVTALTNSPNSISVRLGDGTGSCYPASTFSLVASPNAMCAEDFDGDNKIDLAVISDSIISIFLNCTPTLTCIASVTDSLFNISPLNWGVLPHYSSQVTSAIWHWGDGTSTNGLYPSHTYTTSGWYNIWVTVYTSCGDSACIYRNDTIFKL